MKKRCSVTILLLSIFCYFGSGFVAEIMYRYHGVHSTQNFVQKNKNNLLLLPKSYSFEIDIAKTNQSIRKRYVDSKESLQHLIIWTMGGVFALSITIYRIAVNESPHFGFMFK